MRLLFSDGERAIDLIFRQHYTYITKVILRVIPDKGVAEDIAQEVFYELWRKRDKIKITTSLKAYLRRAAVNRSLNYIRDRKIVFADEAQAPHQESKITSINEQLEAEELEVIIHQAIENLPERCRVIFNLSRFENKSYQEIADALQISPKTVENQIGKALKLLRAAINPFVSRGLITLLLSSLGIF